MTPPPQPSETPAIIPGMKVHVDSDSSTTTAPIAAAATANASSSGSDNGYKGRPRADVWEWFTATANPQRLVSCVCRHCGTEVTHRKKSERAKLHLAKRCPPFRTLMLAVTDRALRPDWFTDLYEGVAPSPKKRRKSDASLPPAASSSTEHEADALTHQRLSLSPSLAPAAPVAVDAAIRSTTIPPASTASTATTIDSALRLDALQRPAPLSTTSTASNPQQQRLQEQQQLLLPRATAATKPLATAASTTPLRPLLSKPQQLQAQQKPVTTTTIATPTTAALPTTTQQSLQQPRAVSPQALSPAAAIAIPTAQQSQAIPTDKRRVRGPYKPRRKAVQLQQQLDALQVELALFLYTTHAPFTTISDAFLQRAIRTLAPHATLPTPTTLATELLDVCYEKVQQAVANSKTHLVEHSTTCALGQGVCAIQQTCVHIIQTVFTQSPPFAALAAFVRDCRALVLVLMTDAALQTEVALEQRALKLPTPLQPLSTHDWLALKRELDVVKSFEDVVFELVSSDAFAQTEATASERQRLQALVTSGRFFDDLDKSLQVLEPLDAAIRIAQAAATTVLNDPVLNGPAPPPLSKAYFALTTALPDAFAALPSLSASERSTLLAVVTRARVAIASRSPAGIAYLLDPRYVGMRMTSDERDAAEEFLSAFSASNGASIDLLYHEFTAFVEKSHSLRGANGFRFQMLVKETKSICQFWKIDGHEWPHLQTVALDVFKQPVQPERDSSRDKARGEHKRRVPKKDDMTTVDLEPVRQDKLAFIRLHAHKLLHVTTDDDVNSNNHDTATAQKRPRA